MPKPQIEQRARPLRTLALAAMTATLYLVLTLPFASFSFGILQFRLAEILTVLPAVTWAAVPGVFLGCLLANLLNPQNLGLIDILGGSLATLFAAILTWWLGKGYRKQVLSGEVLALQTERKKRFLLLRRLILLAPPVLLNALVVGSYLPYLLSRSRPGAWMLLSSIFMIGASQAVVIYGLGLPVLRVMEKHGLFFDQR